MTEGMRLYHELGGILGEIEAAEERFRHSLDNAVREAGEIRVEVLSDDRSVKLAMNGDCTVDSVVIHRRKYEHHDAASLRAAVLSAYQRAILELGGRKRQRVFRALSPDEEQ